MWTQAVRHAIRATRSKLVPLTLALPKMPAACAPANLAAAVSKQAAASGRQVMTSATNTTLLPQITTAGAAARLTATATPSGVAQGLQAARRCMSTGAALPAPTADVVKTFLQMAAGVVAFLAADKALKAAMADLEVTFPAPLIGMFGIFSALCALSAANQQPAADALVGAMRPALRWVQRWLPLFYVAPLVVLPLAMAMVKPEDLGKVRGGLQGV